MFINSNMEGSSTLSETMQEAFKMRLEGEVLITTLNGNDNTELSGEVGTITY